MPSPRVLTDIACCVYGVRVARGGYMGVLHVTQQYT